MGWTFRSILPASFHPAKGEAQWFVVRRSGSRLEATTRACTCAGVTPDPGGNLALPGKATEASIRKFHPVRRASRGAMRALSEADVEPKPGDSRHFDQSIDAEQIDLSPYQIRNARLADAKPACGLPLRPTLTLDVARKLHHETRQYLHTLTLTGICFDRVPRAFERPHHQWLIVGQ
jgi:hypothetical protein